MHAILRPLQALAAAALRTPKARLAAAILASCAAFAAPSAHAGLLTVIVPPGGTVTAPGMGITCTPATSPCNYSMAPLMGLSLLATADPGYAHDGWSSTLGPSSLNPFMFLMPFGDAVVAANFSPLHALTVTTAGHGSGTVGSDPAFAGCGASCTADFRPGTIVTLRAAAAAGSVFGGWMGACTGLDPACTVTVASATNLTAIFLPKSAASTISVGDAHACAVTSAGEAQCWGNGLYGRLGNGSAANSEFPVPVTGLSTGTVSVVTGTYHSCALTEAGAVLCWGGNGWGQLGIGNIQDKLVPVPVPGLGSGMVAVAAGSAHTCALSSTGAVKCWGNNRAGQLGNGTTSVIQTPNPETVTGLPEGVMALAAGVDHTCALTTAGAVHCWGKNEEGELGNGTTTPSLAPVPVSGLASGVVAIAAGYSHTCAIDNAGAVKCWGRNARVDPPGSNTLVDSTVPVPVAGLTGTAIAIGAGAYHTCAVKTGGAVQCWGEGGGRLGDGLTIWSPTPVNVFGFESGAVAVGAGWNSTCAITEVGAARCWGANYAGQLGNGSLVGTTTPVPVSGMGSALGALTGGCGVTNAGSLACWNDGIAVPAESPGRAQGVAAAGAAGNECAIDAAGGLTCAGYNMYGQLGNGTSIDSDTPVPVTGLGSNVVGVGVGYNHTCALTGSGAVRCWGFNDRSQLGNPLSGGAIATSVPVSVTGLESGVASISAGYGHNCAINTAGALLCWGININRELGSGTSVTGSLTPLAVVGLGSGVKSVSAGSLHTCAVTGAGAAMCWGNGFYGQLGNGGNALSPTPVAVAGLGSGVAAIAAGNMHTCALTTAGAVRCWGNNANGELGNNALASTNVPVQVAGLDKGVIAISASWSTRTCALLRDGTARCWGTLVNPAVARTPVRTGNLPRTSSLAFTAPAGVPALVSSGMAGTTMPLAASATSGLPVAFSSITPERCTVAGTTATLHTPGLCVVQAKQPGDAAFDASPTQVRVIAVTPSPSYLLTVTKSGNGIGTVVSNPAGIDCGATCSAPYMPATTIVLTATPAAGSTFVSWSGCDSVNGAACTVAMNTVRGVIATFRRPPVRGDVNGDRKADLFWRESPPGWGLSWWTMDGAAATGYNYHEIPDAWQIADVGDFDGDGKADVVWRRAADGAAYLWTLDGLGIKNGYDLGVLDPAVWTLVGTGDLDGDGKSDLAWRSATGQFYFWLMDGGTIVSQGGPADPIGAEWQVIDIADMNGDGKADIVFHSTTTGYVYMWFMDGVAIGSQAGAGTVDPAIWALLAAADFDGDGKSDLLWRNTAGDTQAWLMNGATYLSGGTLASNPGAGWSIRSVADFDGDGKADLLWRHTDGTTYFWKVDGLTVPAYAPVTNPGGTWRVVAP